jgi:soluble lytic murein transglycosylase-like protein
MVNASVTAQFGERGVCRPGDRSQITRLVRSIAQDEGFDADLAEAIAWAESDFGAVQGPSKAGALGIMQLMPGTAADLGVADRCDAAANVRAGIRYLKSLYDEFQDPLLMLAAYNAGLNKVYEAQGIPVNPETAEYVVKILNRWKFGSLKKPASSKSEIVATALPASADAWQDGHVIDFGN